MKFYLIIICILITKINISKNTKFIPTKLVSNPVEDFFTLNGRRTDPANEHSPKDTFVGLNFNPSLIASHYTYAENENYITYEIITPPLAYWVNLNDIEIHLHTQMLIVKAVGSANPLNKVIHPGYIPNNNLNFHRNSTSYNYLRPINIGRDWEIWINLKQAVKKEAVPLIEKTKNIDNSFHVKVLISKYAIDKTNRFVQYTNIIPFYFKNQTADNFFTDYYHVQIPSQPTYLRRGTTTKKKIHEIYSVTENNSPYIAHLVYSNNSSPLDVDVENMNVIKRLSQEDRKSTLINLDQRYPLHRYFGPTDKMLHDYSYYEALAKIGIPVYKNDSSILNDFVEDHQKEYIIDWKKTGDIVKKNSLN